MRKVFRSTIALVMAVAMLATVGCNQALILAYIEQVAPTVLAVLNLAAAFGAVSNTSRIAEIEQEQANVVDLYKKWEVASINSKPDALNQFNAAYRTFSVNVQEVLTTIRISDPKKQAQINAAVSAGLILLNQIELLIPGNVPNPTQKRAIAKGQFFKSPKDFEKRFNSILETAGHPEFGIR